MLLSLHISHYVLIDSLDITFPEGLVIVTGQTGAGKSILLGALSLLTGGKADADAISENAESCVVEVEFRTEAESGIKEILDRNEIEWNSGSLVIRRTVHRSGRSRCFINDSPVTVQILSEITRGLVDIHSQHKSLLLTEKDFQMNILDHFSNAADEAANCRKAWLKMNATARELASAEEELTRTRAEQDYNQKQFDELESAGLEDGELESLEIEQKALSNAESIKEALCSALNLSRPQDIEQRSDLSSTLKEMRRQLEYAAKYLPSAEDLCKRVESARIEIDDISDSIENAAENVSFSAERLSIVEDRLSRLYSLLRKHECSSIAELIDRRNSYSDMLYGGYELEEKVSMLRKRLQAEKQEHIGICRKLHGLRAGAAPAMSREISDSLRFLELDRAAFEVRIEEIEPGASGCDGISFAFSANGTAPTDVSKCASGGEISRIMLSLKAMMAGKMHMPTMIFDEIDSGVSGSVAAKMGSMICRMGRNMQVFAITHLPQVAAKGDAHYLVSKSFNPESGRASSSISLLEGENRVQEIARMLSSETVTPEAVANARSLISS